MNVIGTFLTRDMSVMAPSVLKENGDVSQRYVLLWSVNRKVINQKQRVKGEMKERDDLRFWQSKGNCPDCDPLSMSVSLSVPVSVSVCVSVCVNVSVTVTVSVRQCLCVSVCVSFSVSVCVCLSVCVCDSISISVSDPLTLEQELIFARKKSCPIFRDE